MFFSQNFYVQIEITWKNVRKHFFNLIKNKNKKAASNETAFNSLVKPVISTSAAEA